VAFLAWSLTPVVTATRYWPVEISDGSAILKVIERNAPSIPETLVTAAQTYANAGDGEVGEAGGLPGPERTQGGPPPKAPVLSQSVALAVRAATLRVEGRACSLIQDGTGVVIARDLVVTNAHVIAGETGSTTVSNGEMTRRADVVAFDPRRDVAVLRVKNLGITPLKFSSPITDAQVAIFGYPGGRELRAEGGRIVDQIKATGGDLYGKGSWSRKVLILAADLVPGDSGGPVVSRSGRLLGLSFAIDPQLPNTSYALDPSEVRAVLKTVGVATVGTGKCLAK
jgi:S1-C subfamily serine protease